jgi:hypothetical protein
MQQSVALHAAQGAGQHALGNVVQAAPDFVEALGAGPERDEDRHAPAIAQQGEDFDGRTNLVPNRGMTDLARMTVDVLEVLEDRGYMNVTKAQKSSSLRLVS